MLVRLACKHIRNMLQDGTEALAAFRQGKHQSKISSEKDTLIGCMLA